MNARVRRVFTVRSMRIMGMSGFTIIVALNLLIVLTAPTTHALSLTQVLTGATQPLTQTLQALTGSSHNSGSNTATPAAASSPNSTATPAAATSSAAPSTTTTTDSAPISEPPIVVDIQPINAMKPLAEPTTTTHPQTSFNPTIAQIIFRAAGINPSFSEDPAPLQSTGQGWRLLGILWYWWALLGAIIVVPSLVFKRFLGSFFRNLVQGKGLFTKI